MQKYPQQTGGQSRTQIRPSQRDGGGGSSSSQQQQQQKPRGVVEIQSAEQYEHLIKQSSFAVVIVDFYTDWCNPCKIVKPKYDQLAQTYSSDHVCFARCNADTVKVKEVRGLPTFDFWLNKKLVHTVLGADMGQVNETIARMGLPVTNNHAALAAKQPPVEDKAARGGIQYKNSNSKESYKTYGSYN